jgi:hypothetical protein
MVALTSVGCGGDETSAAGGAGQGGSGPSGPVTASATSATSKSATSSAQATQASTGVGGSSFVCDPPAEPGSLYELYAESYDIEQLEPISMCEYRGDVLLIVNTAAA